MVPSKKELESVIGKMIADKFKIVKYVNSGGYGDVFQVSHGRRLYAAKIPNANNGSQASINAEYTIARNLCDVSNGVANMEIHEFGEKTVIVMDLLGPSVSTLLSNQKKQNIQTTLLLTIKMLRILKYIHSKGIIHGDVKNNNFVTSRNDKNKLFCIDFGMAKRYVDETTGTHLPLQKSKTFNGTERYASLSSHMYITQSRRDDLESLFYSLVYTHTGVLPWSKIEETDKRKRIEIVYKLKRDVDPAVLCKGMPKEYLIFFKYIQNLRYEDKPHYTTLINMFIDLCDKIGVKQDASVWVK